MINSENYQALIDALSKLFDSMPSSEQPKTEGPKKEKTVTIVSVGKVNKDPLQIPKRKSEKSKQGENGNG
jgi:hypothetical protein